MDILFVIAMSKEANKIIEHYNLKKENNIYKNNNISLIITDIGRNNITTSLIEILPLLKNTTIINIGLVGSNNLNIGEIVQVDKSYGYHFDLTPFGDELYYTKNSPYQLGTIENLKKINCYTSDGFVLKTNIKETCTFDMELNQIVQFPHKDIYSIKIVSDTLSAEKYNEFNYDKAIKEALTYSDKIISSYQK